jgi:hypothetical protein
VGGTAADFDWRADLKFWLVSRPTIGGTAGGTRPPDQAEFPQAWSEASVPGSLSRDDQPPAAVILPTSSRATCFVAMLTLLDGSLALAIAKGAIAEAWTKNCT